MTRSTSRQLKKYHERKRKFADAPVDTTPNELPSDIKYLVTLCMDLHKAYVAKDGANVVEGFRMMGELFKSWE